MSNFNRNYHFSSNYKLVVAIGLAIGLLNSCVTSKKITYLQEYEESEYSTEYVAPEAYRIQVDDNVFIRVTTPDPRWSTMFNTLPVTAGTMSLGEQSADMLSYSVDQDGTVDIPYIGSLSVAGKTISETKEIIERELKDYVSDAAVTVKLVNNYVSILGEVNNPGKYLIFKSQMTIFQALAMAGDVAPYGDRYNVKILRQTIDGTIVKEFDLTDKNIIDSEFYYVMPNDVIYAQPIKGRFFAMNQFPFALILSTITTFVLVMNYIQ